MESITILNYTEAFQQYIKAHPEEAINRHSEAFVIVSHGNVVQSIIRSLN